MEILKAEDFHPVPFIKSYVTRKKVFIFWALLYKQYTLKSRETLSQELYSEIILHQVNTELEMAFIRLRLSFTLQPVLCLSLLEKDN